MPNMIKANEIFDILLEEENQFAEDGDREAILEENFERMKDILNWPDSISDNNVYIIIMMLYVSKYGEEYTRKFLDTPRTKGK